MAFERDLLAHPDTFRGQIVSKFHRYETGVYLPEDGHGLVHLENGYAIHRIANPDAWLSLKDTVRPVEVDIIFTKYPADSTFWLTDYHWLLSKRLVQLFKIDSNLNAKNITYNLVIQTDCSNEFEAQQLYHGIAIHYERVQSQAANPMVESGANFEAIEQIHHFVESRRIPIDSVPYRVMERNDFGPHTALVLDWTASMYGSGAGALLWRFSNNGPENTVSYIGFFNDGNKLPNRKKRVGQTGGVYFTDCSSSSEVIALMKKVKQKGAGGDKSENDIEALLFAQERIYGLKGIILVADNRSCVRDVALISKLNTPVHVILCHTGEVVNPHYIHLALATNGSLHTSGTDYGDLRQMLEADSLIINGMHYKVNAFGQVVITDENGDSPFDDCYKYYRKKVKPGRSTSSLQSAGCYFKD
ncbi:MAG: hypothetical protein Kow0075_05210 [Salibacteraceae bacterium]